jgi:DNA-binding XRE family transcriptional regulator
VQAIVLSEAADIGGDEVRFARQSLGLTQARLAGLLDVAPETVSRWETGSETMSRVSRLASVKDVEGLARIERGKRCGWGRCFRSNGERHGGTPWTALEFRMVMRAGEQGEPARWTVAGYA